MAQGFSENVSYGDGAAAFVHERFDELYDMTPYITSLRSEDYVEGNDIPVIYLEIDYEHEVELPDIPPFQGLIGHTIKIAYAGVEAKGRRYNQFIIRNDMNDCYHGAMDFSIWKQPNCGRTTPGNLHEMFFPELHDNACFPIAFTTILNDQNDRPFCCISFNDFPAFKERMINLIRKYLGIEDFRSLPLGKEAKEIKAKAGKLRKNMWLIDFDWISDLATVTMIGDPPTLIDNQNRCPLELQQSRLAYLQEMSRGRHIPQTRLTRRIELKDTPFGRVIADAVSDVIITPESSNDRQ